MILLLKSYFLIVVFWFLKSQINCEDVEDLYSSIPALEEIFKTEQLYIENTEIFLQNVAKTLSLIKRTKNQINPTQQTTFATNTNLSLKQRLMYKNAMNIIKKLNYKCFSHNMSQFIGIHKFPTNDDLKGVIIGINRLAEVYGLTAREIADGKIFANASSKINFQNCYEIGSELFKLNKIHEAEEWLNLALDLYSEDKKILKEINLWEILSLKVEVKLKYGDVISLYEAIQINKKAIKLNRNSKHLRSQLKFLINKYNANNDAISKLDYEAENVRFYNGCRGNLAKSSKEIRKLYCGYKYGKNSFLKLAPLKFEIQNFKPYVLMFHDVIYDSEIVLLKNLTKNILSRAKVWDAQLGKSVLADYRTSKIAWLSNGYHPVLDILDQRLSDMTDLTMETSEDLQVMNYGIGGHYDVHSDFFPEPKKSKISTYFDQSNMGNRVATVLFYLSEVEKGGATVFPQINTVLYPKKGVAAFWFNLLPSGAGNIRSRHAACPIIFGSKWVANKWIRYNGQAFLSPCGLTEYGNFKIFQK